LKFSKLQSRFTADHHALLPFAYPSYMTGSVWRFEIDRLSATRWSKGRFIFRADREVIINLVTQLI
jgi:hypothetical protein